MKKGFSIVEFAFVVVILGALAGVAVTRIFNTRTDSQISMLQGDVNTLLRQLPAEVMARNINIETTTPPQDFKTWGEWLMHVGSLNRERWKPTTNGVVAISNIKGKNDRSGQVICEGDYLYVDTTKGQINFIPKNIKTDSSIFCKTFADSYSSISGKVIDLKQ